jgi:hypothetical protein
VPRELGGRKRGKKKEGPDTGGVSGGFLFSFFSFFLLTKKPARPIPKRRADL